MSDEIRTIADAWEDFNERQIIHPDLPPETLEEFRWMFYAGFKACFRIFGEIDAGEAAGWACEIDDEIKRFTKDLLGGPT